VAVAKLDHEKANRKIRGRDAARYRPRDFSLGERVQEEMRNFVARHHISCFKCKRTDVQWAKTKIEETANGPRPWAICKACVRQS
jgi:hypothetical protein